MTTWHAALEATSLAPFETQLDLRSETERSSWATLRSLQSRLRHRPPTFRSVRSNSLSRLVSRPGRSMFPTWERGK
jgi:hypothetical protein